MNRCTNCGLQFDGCHPQCEECRIEEAPADAEAAKTGPKTFDEVCGQPGAFAKQVALGSEPRPEQFTSADGAAETGGEETLSPELMHSKGSPGRTSVGDTFRCYNCHQPVQRIHAAPDRGYCARCDKVVSERPPLMPGRPDTFLCPNGHTAKRIMWSANGWCDECGDIVEEEE